MSDRETKRAQFEGAKKKSWLPLLVLGVFMLAGIGLLTWKFSASGGTKYPAVRVVDGQAAIPLQQVDDGRAHFFSYKNGATSIDFFVLKSRDGVMRAAFDACDVCYRDKQGYRQEGDEMVCVNCGQRFHSNLINEVKGGCNPAPLERRESDGRLLIREADLLQGARCFEGI